MEKEYEFERERSSIHLPPKGRRLLEQKLKADEEYFLKRGYAELAHYVGGLREDLQKSIAEAKKACSICDLDLSEDKWLYYEKQGICICHFCYNDLELKGEEGG